MEVVTAGDIGADFESHPSIDLESEADRSGRLVLAEGGAVVGRHGDVNTGDKRRPDVDVLVALVNRRNGGVIGDLLAAVGGEDVELVVVDADLVVGVTGVNGYLFFKDMYYWKLTSIQVGLFSYQKMHKE